MSETPHEIKKKHYTLDRRYEFHIFVSRTISHSCATLTLDILVPKKTGDLRPVINLKPWNQFVQRIHFKMENIQMAMNFVSLGDYMVSLDLKEAYFSVPIFRPHCKYLRFIWRDQRYEFTCLPFGYSLAPRVFTKIFKPIVAQLRLNGLRIVIFLDDILLVASSFAECIEQLSLLRKLLESLGYNL